MLKNNHLENEPGTAEEMGWEELDELAEQADEIVELHGESVLGCEKIQQMITAVRERNIDILKQLASGDIFPYRKNIHHALRLLVKNIEIIMR